MPSAYKQRHIRSKQLYYGDNQLQQMKQFSYVKLGSYDSVRLESFGRVTAAQVLAPEIEHRPGARLPLYDASFALADSVGGNHRIRMMRRPPKSAKADSFSVRAM